MVDPYQVVLGAIAVAIIIAVPILCVALFDLTAGRWDEPAEPRHPLTGIVCALERGGPEGVVALACDTPLLPPRLLRALAARAALTVVRTPDGRVHPLPGRFPAALLAPLAAARDAQAPLGRTLRELGVALLDEDDPRGLLNVNRPEDLARAQASL